ncbi:MAG TPA: substrate-binding domain-containing protein [Vicinamibacterales bacterium]|jgi:ribose transport system substrate-binding protein|nr:substrate-binding domain-containing protein [Vicinamibacterales bacterium]
MASRTSPYIVKSLVHAAKILEAFQSSGEVLRLRDVVDRTGFGKGMCFRLLHTLHHCGFVEKVDERRYRLTAEIGRRKRFRIGYASQGQDSSFPREVHAGLLRAVEREHLELIVIDNRYQAKVALRNAEHLIKEKVDLVIEFQTDESVAPAIASKYLEAGIPLIAIDIPHPGATYFGANNYQAGLLAGRYLGKYAQTCWNGQVDEILVLELARAGSLVRARSKGILAGVHETLHGGDTVPVTALDGDGQFKLSLEKVRRHLRFSKARRILVGAANDPSALGAVRAFQEAGRELTCAVVGQNAEPDARVELRERRTPFVASVGYFPERYGAGLVRLALDILAKKPVPPAVFMRHQIITAQNVDHFYPNDSVTGVTGVTLAG